MDQMLDLMSRLPSNSSYPDIIVHSSGEKNKKKSLGLLNQLLFCKCAIPHQVTNILFTFIIPYYYKLLNHGSSALPFVITHYILKDFFEV